MNLVAKISALVVLVGVLVPSPALAQPTDDDWAADTIAVKSVDAAEDVRVDHTDEVEDSYFEQTDLGVTRIVIKRAAAVPRIKVVFHPDAVMDPTVPVAGHAVFQFFGISTFKDRQQSHITGIEAGIRSERVTVSHDLEVRPCRDGRRTFDTDADIFTIVVPLKCLRWTNTRWGRIEAGSALVVKGTGGRGVDTAWPWTRAVPLIAK